MYHFGDVPRFNAGPSEKSLVKDAGNGGQVVVGDFTLESDGETDRYVMLVNKSMTQSWCCNPTFTRTPAKVQYVSPITGELKRYPAPYYWLAPGQGVLLKLEW